MGEKLFQITQIFQIDLLFFDDFRGNRNKLIRLNPLNIRSEI